MLLRLRRGPDREERRLARCGAVHKAMVEGLRQFYLQRVCHDIADRVFVLVDGIAINALLDPGRSTHKRQMAVLQQGLEDVLARR